MTKGRRPYLAESGRSLIQKQTQISQITQISQREARSVCHL